jgi:hypothetical protein
VRVDLDLAIGDSTFERNPDISASRLQEFDDSIHRFGSSSHPHRCCATWTNHQFVAFPRRRECWTKSPPTVECLEPSRCDNGPEFTSRHFLAWAVERQIELIHI